MFGAKLVGFGPGVGEEQQKDRGPQRVRRHEAAGPAVVAASREGKVANRAVPDDVGRQHVDARIRERREHQLHGDLGAWSSARRRALRNWGCQESEVRGHHVEAAVGVFDALSPCTERGLAPLRDMDALGVWKVGRRLAGPVPLFEGSYAFPRKDERAT